MKISSKLAYSQLKINRSRTILTLLGIALSTALITAICSFVASGNSMIVDLLGSDYGDYGDSYMRLLLIPAIIFSGIIVAMSVTVVSNVFRISARERVNQFGILKSVGATKEQITATVMYESIFVSLIGIPTGIILGLILAFIGINVANYFMGELNSLVHMMMNEITLKIDFVISWQAILIATIISFISVLFSAWVPAHKAAKITAIDSIRGTGETKVELKQIKTSRLVERIFGFEGTLAAKNMKRSRRIFRATVISLTIGIVLFINVSALGKQANEMQKFMSPDMNATVISEYASTLSYKTNEKTGNEEVSIRVPIDGKTGNTVTEKLRKFKNTKTFGVGYDMETYDAIIPLEEISDKMLEALADDDKEKRYEPNDKTIKLSAEIINIDQKNYEKLCKKAGVPIGSNILINHYNYNNNGNKEEITPFSLGGNPLKLIKGDGSTSEIEVQGILTKEEIPEELFAPNSNDVRVILPEADVRGYTWFSDPSNIEGFIDYSNNIMDEIFPNDEGASYMEAGFNTRVYKINDYMKVMNIAIVIVLIFMYGFVVLLMLIGLTNVISTMSTNVLMRSREFAVLQSVGMTPEGLQRMLNLESVLCSLKAVLIGLPIAILLTYLINLPIRKTFPISYKLPWLAILLCTLAVFMITWVTTRCAASRLKNRNIIEAIRSESGR